MSKKAAEEFQYNASGLLDHLLERCKLKNDAALARHFEVAPPVLSKLRHNRMPVGDSFILKCIEIVGMTAPEIRAYIGGRA